METKTKYTALVSFLVEIECDSRWVADYIASKAVPEHFGYMMCGTDGSGSGKFKKALAPMVMIAGGEV